MLQHPRVAELARCRQAQRGTVRTAAERRRTKTWSRARSRAGCFLYAGNCHCSNCRAGTGSAFKPFAGIERDKLEVVEGADTLLVWGDEKDNHTRCGICDSLLYSVVRGGRYVHIAMGSFADEPSIRPAEHIFVGSKAPWFEITDELPQSNEY
jgi:hypothetical protein